MNVQKKLLQELIKIKLNTLGKISPSLAGKELLRLFCTPVSRYRVPVSSSFKGAAQTAFELNNQKVNGYIANKGAERKALILHGFTSSLAKFEHMVNPLINLGYEVLAFDAPAHGHSEGDMVNALDYAQMITEICREYGPVHAFIAHSFGGIGVCLALEEHKHLQENAKLVMIAPAAETETAINNAFTFLGLDNPLFRKAMADEIYKQSGRQPSWFSINRAIDNIHMPVLWIQDEDDFITPITDMQPVQNKNLPNISFKISKGLGHQRIYKDEKTVAAITQFLT